MFKMRRTGSTYAIYLGDTHVRDVELDEVGPETQIVMHANSVITGQINDMMVRAKRMAAARRAIGIINSRSLRNWPRLEEFKSRTFDNANKARSHV